MHSSAHSVAVHRAGRRIAIAGEAAGPSLSINAYAGHSSALQGGSVPFSPPVSQPSGQQLTRVLAGAPTVAVVTDIHYKLMRLLQANPEMSQRDLARELGISLGRVNYCLRALIKKGWVKATNFTNSQNKAAYMYLLTPRGIEQKASLAVKFLQVKLREYEALREEISQIRRETGLDQIGRHRRPADEASAETGIVSKE